MVERSLSMREVPGSIPGFSKMDQFYFNKLHHYGMTNDQKSIREMSERGQPELNWWPLDLQSNALPLSYTPNMFNGCNGRFYATWRWTWNISNVILSLNSLLFGAVSCVVGTGFGPGLLCLQNAISWTSWMHIALGIFPCIISCLASSCYQVGRGISSNGRALA